MPVQIVVLGAGPGGLAAAHEGIRHGHNVTLVDPEGLGGNALKHSLIPSKVLIQAAETLNRAGEWGARWDASSWQAIMEVQTRLINDAERDAKRLLSQARVIAEFAHLASARHVVTDTSHTVLEADVIVIAIGSRHSGQSTPCTPQAPISTPTNPQCAWSAKDPFAGPETPFMSRSRDLPPALPCSPTTPGSSACWCPFF